MPRGYSSEPITLSFPPFTRAVAWLVGINICVFFALVLLGMAPATAEIAHLGTTLAALTPALAVHGMVWQLVTYSFLNGGLPLFFNMLMLWMFGAQLEQAWGTRRLLSLYFTSVVGAGLMSIGIAYTGAFGFNSGIPITGAAPGLYGIYVAFGIAFAEAEIMMFPLPFLIKAKYFTWILIVVTLAMSLQQGPAVIPLLGGLLFGFLYVKWMYGRATRRSYAPGVYRGRGLSDRDDSPAEDTRPIFERWRDSYYRWKRRRAARKFEVYMRKHDRQVFFDEQGRYIDPDSPEGRHRDPNKENGKPWVN